MNNNIISSFANANASDSAGDGNLPMLHIYMDTFLCFTHFGCASIGLPLNFVVISTILHSKRLRQSRNITWLGIAFSHIIILFNRIFELVVYVTQDRTLCSIFVFMVGLPHAILLLNSFLALVDRYVSITYFSWYKRHVKSHYIVVGQVIAVSLLIIVTKFHYIRDYIFRLANVDCYVNSSDGIEVSVVIHILIMLCIVGQIIVYCKTKKILTNAANPRLTISAVHFERRGNLQTPEGSVIMVINGDETNCDTSRQQRRFLRKDMKTISHLEVEATRNLIAGIFSLFVFAIPSCALFTIGMGCVHLFNDVEKCSAVIWASAYTSGLSSFITIYNPIFFIFRCRDFFKVFQMFLSKYEL